MVLQVTLFSLMVSFFSVSVQDWLSINNCKLLNLLYFYTNFIFLILLICNSLTNSPSVLLYSFFFIFFNMVRILLYLPYNCVQDSFSKWFGALSFSVTFYLLSTSTHTHLLCLCLSITRCDHRRSGLHKEKTCRSVSSTAFLCYFFMYLTCFRNFYYFLFISLFFIFL